MNLAIALHDHHAEQRSARQFRANVCAQFLLDSVLLALLIRWTGGFSSPFLSLSLPIAVGAGLLLAPRQGLFVALMALMLPALTGGLWATNRVLDLSLPGATWLATVIGGCATVLLCLAETPRLRRRHRSAASPRRMRQSSRTLVEQMAMDLATHVRDPLGSVRARAELLKLSPRRGQPGSEHDLELLLDGLGGIERALRGILAFLPPSRVGSQIDLNAMVQEEWARGGQPESKLVVVGDDAEVRGSHAEISLAVDFLLTLARDHGVCEDGARVVLRVDPEGDAGVFELIFRPAVPARWQSAQQGVIGDSDQASIFLPLTILDRIASNHGGRLEISASPGRIRLSLFLKSFSVIARPGVSAEPSLPLGE